MKSFLKKYFLSESLFEAVNDDVENKIDSEEVNTDTIPQEKPEIDINTMSDSELRDRGVISKDEEDGYHVSNEEKELIDSLDSLLAKNTVTSEGKVKSAAMEALKIYEATQLGIEVMDVDTGVISNCIWENGISYIDAFILSGGPSKNSSRKTISTSASGNITCLTQLGIIEAVPALQHVTKEGNYYLPGGNMMHFIQGYPEFDLNYVDSRVRDAVNWFMENPAPNLPSKNTGNEKLNAIINYLNNEGHFYKGANTVAAWVIVNEYDYDPNKEKYDILNKTSVFTSKGLKKLNTGIGKAIPPRTFTQNHLGSQNLAEVAKSTNLVEIETAKKMVTNKGTKGAPIPFTIETVGNFFSPIAEEEDKLSGTVEVGTPVATPIFKDEEEEREEKERKLASAPKTPDGEPLLSMSDCFDEKGNEIPELLKKFKEQTPFRKAYMKEMKKKAVTQSEEKSEDTEKEKAESFKEELSDECLFEDGESTAKQNDAFVDVDNANYNDGLKRNLRSFIKEYKKYVGIPEDCVCTHVNLGLVERICNRYGYSLQDVLTYGIRR